MYRMILNEEPNEDARKTHYEIMREVYSHTENKQDVSRNMLATLFVRDPAKFRGEQDEVQKVVKNNIAWPQGYVPQQFVVKRPPPKSTKEEIHYANLKIKHEIKMAPLNKFYLDDEIQDLNKICTTKDAHMTYK